MKNKNLMLLLSLFFLFSCSDDDKETIINPVIEPNLEISISPASLTMPASASSQNVVVASNSRWTLTSNQTWCKVTPTSGYAGETSLQLSVDRNRSGESRSATLTFTSLSETTTQTYTVNQELGKDDNFVPSGYSIVWQDEFDDKPNSNGALPLPGDKWWFETGNNYGWGNNEPQYYIDRVLGNDTVAKIQNESLVITAIKLDTPHEGFDIISTRMNTKESWLYGYFEARAKVPGGRGTWAAFWMMPKNFQAWPLDGEIDILEYVGYRPYVVQSSIHTLSYNHSIGTEKTGMKNIATAETEFHIYGLEWTKDKIIGYVDGQAYFTFENDGTGNKETWPFNEPFYLKLNLAIGGNWGGTLGIDPAIFPSRYEIDYVRVYQK